MTLSEAIRAGAKLQPQAFGPASINWENGLGTCALGAACQALGIVSRDHEKSEYKYLEERYPWMSVVIHPSNRPMEVSEGYDVMTYIYLLNDRARWTREAIADWVETVEPKEER